MTETFKIALLTGGFAVLSAFVATAGAIFATVLSNKRQSRTESLRFSQKIMEKEREEARATTLKAVLATHDLIEKLLAFNTSMYGNKGKGKDDRRSAAALEEFIVATNNLSTNEVELAVVGNQRIAQEVSGIKDRIMDYLNTQFETRRFSGELAMNFGQEITAEKQKLLDLTHTILNEPVKDA